MPLRLKIKFRIIDPCVYLSHTVMICSLRYCVRTFLLIKRLPFEISNIDPYLDVIFYGYVLDFLK